MKVKVKENTCVVYHMELGRMSVSEVISMDVVNKIKESEDQFASHRRYLHAK